MNHSLIKRQSLTKRRGAVVVETAIVLPIFLLVLLGIMEFGRAMMVSQLVTTAARDANRMAIMSGSSNAECEDLIEEFLNNTLGLAAGDITINISVTKSGGGTLTEVGDAVQGDLCVISVEIPFDKVSLVQGSYLVGKMLSGDSQMRHL